MLLGTEAEMKSAYKNVRFRSSYGVYFAVWVGSLNTKIDEISLQIIGDVAERIQRTPNTFSKRGARSANPKSMRKKDSPVDIGPVELCSLLTSSPAP